MTRGRVAGIAATNYAYDTFRAVLAQAAALDQTAAEALAARAALMLEDLAAGSDSEAVRSAVAVVGSRRGWGPYARIHTRAYRGAPEEPVTATSATSTATSPEPPKRGRLGWSR